jgi:hypothetical protein
MLGIDAEIRGLPGHVSGEEMVGFIIGRRLAANRERELAEEHEQEQCGSQESVVLPQAQAGHTYTSMMERAIARNGIAI